MPMKDFLDWTASPSTILVVYLVERECKKRRSGVFEADFFEGWKMETLEVVSNRRVKRKYFKANLTLALELSYRIVGKARL